jgi:hypothetical protein
MSCDESQKEDLSVRLNNYSKFTEAWKQDLKQSTTSWCQGCRKKYKKDTCEKVTEEAKISKRRLPNHTYKDDVDTLKDICDDMKKQINSLPSNLKNMNLSALELEKEELLEKSKRLTSVLQGCFNDRTSYSNNCIFDKNTDLPSTDKGHNKVEKQLLSSINMCEDVYKITSDNDKWKNRIQQLYGKEYPTDNLYDKPISPKRSKRRSKRSSRGKKSSIKKVGKRKGMPITSKRMKRY